MARLVLTGERLIQLFDDYLTVMGIIDPSFESLPDQRRALSPIEALMRSAPGEGVDASQIELLGLRELLEDALDELDDEEREAILACVVERAPLRKKAIAKTKYPYSSYSKSGIAKVRDRALEKLRKKLEHEPLVLQHIANNHLQRDDDEDG